MTRFVSADFIYCPERGLLTNHVIELDDAGTIISLFDRKAKNGITLDFYPGILVPGFVNSHCHLELSHLKNRLDSGTMLIPFLKSVVQLREVDPDFIQDCIRDADNEMQKEGIVAVGDICNKTDTLECKINSPIYYHSFIECFDFFQQKRSAEFFKPYHDVFEKYADQPKSLVPHAPYSVSPSLFSLIDAGNLHNPLISIHNQETAAEDALFIIRDPAFIEFFESFGFNMEEFIATGKPSVYYTMQHLKNVGNLLLVHNTKSRKEIIRDILKWHAKTFFVSCPNANLYIENTLPDYEQFENACMCLGTDSLSSNWQLSILEEIKTIQKYKSYIPLEQLFNWGTLNGAKALQIDDRFGSFAERKRPGINWIREIELKKNHIRLAPNAKVSKVI